MNQKNQESVRRSLVRRLFVLAALLASFAFFTPSPFAPARASDWPACDAAYIDGAVPSCITTYNQCFAGCAYDSACETSCTQSYQNCQAEAQTERDTCMEGATPQPLPVQDDRRSSCMSACGGCAEIEDPMASLLCGTACWNYCNETYPK